MLLRRISQVIWHQKFKFPIVNLHTANSWANLRHEETLSNPKPHFEFPIKSQVKLTSQIVECTLSRCPSNIITLGFFLWCGRQPNYFHNPLAFDYMVPIVSRLTERLKSVRSIAGELESVGSCLKAQTFLVLLRIYWRGGMYGLALEAFEEMSNSGYVPNTFAHNIVIDVLFKIGRVNMAFLVLKRIKFPNFLTFNTVLCNLCKLSDWYGVRDILRDMVKKGFTPNNGSFAMALNCLCKAGRLDEALQLLCMMITLGHRLSVTIWSVLIDGFCRGGRVVLANQLCIKMVAGGISPSVVTYTSLVKGFIEMDMFDQALEVVDVMESDGCFPDVVFYNMLIDCFSKVGRHSDALKVFHDLPSKNLKPDAYTFSSILSSLCLSGEFTLLCELVRQMDVQADLILCNSILNLFCKIGLPSQAVEFYNDMIHRGFTPDSYSYAGLLSGLCRSGRINEAIDVYHAVVNNSSVDAPVHTVIFDGLTKVGKFETAFQLFRKAVTENYSLDVVSYSIAIHGLFKDGRLVEAHNLHAEMKEAGLAPNICTYNVMLCGLCKGRDVYAIKQLLVDMDNDGIKLDSISFNAIISFLCKSHRVKSALRMFLERYNLGFKLNKATFAQLFESLCRVGAIDEASRLLEEYLEFKIFISAETLDRFGGLAGGPLSDNGLDLEETSRSVNC